MQPPETVLHSCPCRALQAPLASQVPAQRPFGSSVLFAATQLCEVVSHFMQVPVQSAVVQHPVVGMHTVVPPLVQDFVDAAQA